MYFLKMPGNFRLHSNLADICEEKNVRMTKYLNILLNLIVIDVVEIVFFVSMIELYLIVNVMEIYLALNICGIYADQGMCKVFAPSMIPY